MKLHTFFLLPVLAASALLAADADIGKAITDAAAWESGKDMAPLRTLETLVYQSKQDPKLRRDLEAGLVALLAKETPPEAKRFACQQLAVIGSDQSLAAISMLLSQEETAGYACYALRKNPSPKADDTLLNALPSLTGRPRLQVLYTIGGRHSDKAVPALAALAHSSDLPTAEAALGALGEIGSKESVAALTTLRKDLLPALEPVMYDALLRAADRLAEANIKKSATEVYSDLLAANRPVSVRRGALLGLFRVDSDKGEKRILETLRGTDALLKPIAISAVPALPSSGASKKIALELSRLSPAEQAMLIEALAARRDSQAKAAITGQITAQQLEVRLAAIAALGQIGDVKAVPLLVNSLATAVSADEQAVAEQALVTLPEQARIDQAIIAETINAKDFAKARLIPVLSRRNLRSALSVLLDAASSSDKAVIRAAFTALSRLAEESDLGTMLDKLSGVPTELRTEAEASVMQVLGRVENEDRRSGIVCDRLPKAATVDAKCSLIRILPGAGGAKALAAVQQAITDPTPQIRDAAVRALGEWRNLSAWDSLLATYRQPQKETYRVLALRGMVRLLAEDNVNPSPTLFARYQDLLKGARNDSDHRLILGALASAAHPDALPLTFPLLTNPEIRPEVEQTIRQIATAIRRQHPQAAQAALSKLK
jgi:HEAT repeat protein